MKRISLNHTINDCFFTGKIPDETSYLPAPEYECPVFSEPALISPTDCKTLVDDMIKGGCVGVAGTGVGIRKSRQYLLTAHGRAIYEQAFTRVRPKIETFYNASLAYSTGAHGLAYEPGDRYDVHCDNCDPVLDPHGKVIRFEYTLPNRQISTLLFLSDSVDYVTQPLECMGGNLSFPFIVDRNNDRLLVEPQAGLFVAFPSNPFFAHEVHEVLEGFRMVIVDWHCAHFHHQNAPASC